MGHGVVGKLLAIADNSVVREGRTNDTSEHFVIAIAGGNFLPDARALLEHGGNLTVHVENRGQAILEGRDGVSARHDLFGDVPFSDAVHVAGGYVQDWDVARILGELQHAAGAKCVDVQCTVELLAELACRRAIDDARDVCRDFCVFLRRQPQPILRQVTLNRPHLGAHEIVKLTVV